jgi:hypothetical protein
MQTTLFQRLFTSRTAPAQGATARCIAAPVELKASALAHVAGGGSPNGGWTSSLGSPNGGWSSATTTSPNGGW